MWALRVAILPVGLTSGAMGQAAGHVTGNRAYCSGRVQVPTGCGPPGAPPLLDVDRYGLPCSVKAIEMVCVCEGCDPTLHDTTEWALHVLVMHHEKLNGCVCGCGTAPQVNRRSAWGASAATTGCCRLAWLRLAAVLGSPPCDAAVDGVLLSAPTYMVPVRVHTRASFVKWDLCAIRSWYSLAHFNA
jgi:hypothetical protein